MLEEVKIAGVASYSPTGSVLKGLRAINFVFGTNGTGKTTISRVISSPADHPTCSLAWTKNQPLEAHVYNRDFIERNYTPQLRGIFTLGEVEKSTLEQIESAKAKVKDGETTIGQLQGTLGNVDGSTGKRAELKALRTKFETDCWSIKGKHDAVFKDAFTGARNSASKFCDRVISETETNKAAVVDFESLKTRSASLFGNVLTKLSLFPALDGSALVAAETEAVLAKKVVGKEDVDVAGLIRRLGNSDWVRQGLKYLDHGNQCPFCQQGIEADLAVKLNEYFDETFINDMADLSRLSERYDVHAEDILEKVEGIHSSGSSHIDAARLRASIDKLRSKTEINKRLIDAKKKEPSSPVALEGVKDLIDDLVGQIEAGNGAIEAHNSLVDNISSERTKLINEIWRFILNENALIIDDFTTKKSALEKAIQGLTAQIQAKEAQLAGATQELHELEKKITSVQPTVDDINGLLSSFGFSGFKLKTAGDKNHLYEIVRDDGGNASATLSEGEKTFVTFLYFYHSLRGSMSETGVNTERVVVFDDPVSSLDSDVLFIVSALIKRVLKEARQKNGQIKQVILLTHNIYFHKEVSFDKDRQNKAMKHETFWIVRKNEGVTELTSFDTNPIKTSYELLWDEVRNPHRSRLTIQNTLRRIIENYFKILGSVDTDEIVAKFKGKEQQICGSLFSWINDGSHHAHDDLYISADEGLVARYLEVFRRIFEETGHEAHYKMMMRIEAETDEESAGTEGAAPAAARG